ESGLQAAAETAAILSAAENPAAALTADRAEKQAGALSGSEYRLAGFEFAVPGGLYLSDKEIRNARQAAVTALHALRGPASAEARSPEAAVAWMDGEALEGLRRAPRVGGIPSEVPARLNLLLRERSSLEALAGLPVHTVFFDFEHGKDYKSAVADARAMGFRAGIATTRILKPAEYHNLKVIEAIAPDAVLVRNLGALRYLAGKGLTLDGDFSLNVSNSLTAAYLAGKGLAAICPSYDLNQWQLFDLLDAVAAADPDS